MEDTATKRLVLLAALISSTLVTAANAQFGGVVFDPTQSTHAIQQLYQGTQLYTTTVQTYQTAISAYNFSRQMMTAPQLLYRTYSSPNTYWTALTPSANTYGNTQPWMNAATMAVALLTPFSRRPSRARRNSPATAACLPFYNSRSLPREPRGAGEVLRLRHSRSRIFAQRFH